MKIDKLKLLAGMPIEIPNVGKVYPLKLREIAELGEEKYNQYLNVLTFDKEDIEEIKNEKGEKIDLTPFEILVGNMYFPENDFSKVILEAFSLFFREQVYFLPRADVFYLGKLSEKRIIHKDNFEEIRNIIKIQNCIMSKEEKEEFNPANEKARQIIEKMKKNRKKIREIKSRQNGDEEKLGLFDLVSILASHGNNLNILNIWDLTIYQFQDQFNRMQMIEEYEINIQALLHGADSKKIKLKHWMRKIENE